MAFQQASPLPAGASGGGSYDIGRAFSYTFEDTEWIKKLLIGGVVNLIPIVNFAATGYGLAQLRRVYDGRELPLPEWNDFGGYFVKGLLTWVAGFIYSLPLVLLYCCFVGVPAIFLSNSQDQSSAGNILGFVGICFACIALLYALALAVFLPALYTRYALSEQFSSFFQFREALQFIQFNTGGYITAVLVSLLAIIGAGLVGGIACGVGSAFTGFWALLVVAFVFGKFAQGVPGLAVAPSATPPGSSISPASPQY